MSVMSFFSTPLQVGNVQLNNRVFLAPLAGVSDVPFRRICQELGAGLTYVEMLSATAITYTNKKTFEMMSRHPSEKVLGVQVTGPSADKIGDAIRVLDGMGFETIDINMGCPVRKVVSAGCGSALIKDSDKVEQIVETALGATSRPLSVKCRLGYTRDAINIDETARRVSRRGAFMFTVHGRTRSENYSTPVDRKGIRQGLATAREHDTHKKIVTVGNGDVFDFSSAQAMRVETLCDAVMVSRGALGNPWVFKEILEGKVTHPTFEEWYDVVMRHIDYHEEFYGNTRVAAVLSRKHLLWYVKGFAGSKLLRDKLNYVESLAAARELLREYRNTIPLNALRYERTFSSVEKPQNEYDPKYEMDRELDRGVGDEGMVEQA